MCPFAGLNPEKPSVKPCAARQVPYPDTRVKLGRRRTFRQITQSIEHGEPLPNLIASDTEPLKALLLREAGGRHLPDRRWASAGDVHHPETPDKPLRRRS